MVNCSIFRCKSRSEQRIPDLTFHAFPAALVVTDKWIKATGRLGWQPTKYSKVCSIHFKKSDIIGTNKRKYLNPNAVPALNVPREIEAPDAMPSQCQTVTKSMTDSENQGKENVDPNLVKFPMPVPDQVQNAEKRKLSLKDDVKPSDQENKRIKPKRPCLKLPLTASERCRKYQEKKKETNPQKFEEMKLNIERSKAKKRKTEDIYEVKNKEVNTQHSLNKVTKTSIIERFKEQIFDDIERPIVVERLEKQFNDDDDCNNYRACAEEGLEEQPRGSDKNEDDDYKIMIFKEESLSNDVDDYRQNVKRAEMLGEQTSNNNRDDDRPDVTDRLEEQSSDDNNDSEDDRSSVTVSVEGQPFYYDEDDGPAEVQFHDVEEKDSLVPDTTPLSWQKCKSIPIQTGGDSGMEAEQPHQGFKCNQCTGDIVGFRYTCVQCADWDLCAACEARGLHPNHYMLRVPGPRPHAEIQDVVARIRTELFRGLQLQAGGLPSLASVKTEVKEEEESDPLRDIYEEDIAIANYHEEITPEVRQTSPSHIKTAITTSKENVVSNTSLLTTNNQPCTSNIKTAITTLTKDIVLLRNNKQTSTPNINKSITTLKEDIVSNTSLLRNNNQPCTSNIETAITTLTKDIVLLRNNKQTSTPNIKTSITTLKEDIVSNTSLLRNNNQPCTPNIHTFIMTSKEDIVSNASLLKNNNQPCTSNIKTAIEDIVSNTSLLRNNKQTCTPNIHTFIMTSKEDIVSNASLLRNNNQPCTSNIKTAITTSKQDIVSNTLLLRNNKQTCLPNIKRAITTSKEDIVSNTSLLRNNNQPCTPNIHTFIMTSKEDIVSNASLLKNNSQPCTSNIKTAIEDIVSNTSLLRNNKQTCTPNMHTFIMTSKEDIVSNASLLRNNNQPCTSNIKTAITTSKEDIVSNTTLPRNNKQTCTPNINTAITTSKEDIVSNTTLLRNNKVLLVVNSVHAGTRQDNMIRKAVRPVNSMILEVNPLQGNTVFSNEIQRIKNESIKLESQSEDR